MKIYLCSFIYLYALQVFVYSANDNRCETYYNLKIPPKYPIKYIPVALDDIVATYMPIWRGYTLNENIYSFAYSMGARALHDSLNSNEEDAFQFILDKLKDTQEALNSTKFVFSPILSSNNKSFYQSSHVVVPLLIDGDAVLAVHSYVENNDDDIKNTTIVFLKKYLPGNGKSSAALLHFQTLLYSQIKLAQIRQMNSKSIFENAIRVEPISNLNPIFGVPNTLKAIFEDSKQRIDYYEMYKNINYDDTPKIMNRKPKHGMVILGKYLLSKRRLDIFVINLVSSPYRRMYIANELKRANMNTSNVHFTPAVDGMMVPLENLKDVLKHSRNTVIHQGAIGCALSHISIWRNILKLGLPYSLILEDDAVLLPNAEKHINVGLNAIYDAIGNDWDVIVTDFGSSPHVGIESLRPYDTPQHCIHAYYSDNTEKQLFVDITGTPCSHINSVSYIISYRGAKKLLKHLIPFEYPIDVEMLRLVEKGVIRTIALLPFVSGQVFQKTKSGTDMIERFITMENGEAKYTFKSISEQNCVNERCVLRVYSTDRN
jgi:GR25 family glycosyltransferase involved in LPS biosynthesis